MKYLKVVLILLAVILFGFTAITPLDNYINSLRLNEIERFPEKTYIHTDKPFYTTKDTIWFKNYLVNGITHKQTTKSNVVYVELISPKDSILYKKKFYIQDNTFGAPGDITIDPKWESGVYQIRSYTNYMRNHGENYFFRKSIRIEKEEEPKEALAYVDEKQLNTTVIDTITSLSKIKKIDLKFYPEGGKALSGRINKFGIKAVDEKGNGVKVLGAIKEKGSEDVIIRFRTFDFGLGNMAFELKKGKEYVAEVQLNGRIQRYFLGNAESKGVQLNIINNEQSLILKVNSNTEKLKDYFLIGHMRGKIFFNKILKKNSDANYKLLTEELPEGVAHFTVFDASGKPKSERLVFIEKPSNNVKAKIIINKKTVKKRSQVSYNIEVLGKDEVKKNASLSLSVTQKNSVPLSIKENIKSWLLLNSDLRGEIPSAAVFFDPTKTKQKKKYLLESLMLTHGWRRFTWEDQAKYRKEGFEYGAEKGITVSGKVIALDKDLYNSQVETTFLVIGDNYVSKKTKIKANGRFFFKNLIFNDSVDALVQAKALQTKEKKQRKFKILLDPEKNSPEVKTAKEVTTEKENLFFENYKNIKNYINQVNFTFNGANTLDEVVITGKSKNTTEDFYDDYISGFANASYGSPSNRVILDSIIGGSSLTVLNLLQNIPGVNVFGDNRVTIRGGGIGSGVSSQSLPDNDNDNSFIADVTNPDELLASGAALILIDGVESTPDQLSFLTGNDVGVIDVLKGPEAAIFGSRGVNGVIAIYSKPNRSLIVTNDAPGIINFKINPFYKAREFFSKNYFSETAKSDVTPDYRTTLYWNPSANALANKVVSTIFYTGDQTGTFQFELEGITEDGELVYQTAEIEVVE